MIAKGIYIKDLLKIVYSRQLNAKNPGIERHRGFDYGAGHEIRTRDFDLGKVALYHWVSPAEQKTPHREAKRFIANALSASQQKISLISSPHSTGKNTEELMEIIVAGPERQNERDIEKADSEVMHINVKDLPFQTEEPIVIEVQ